MENKVSLMTILCEVGKANKHQWNNRPKLTSIAIYNLCVKDWERPHKVCSYEQ